LFGKGSYCGRIFVKMLSLGVEWGGRDYTKLMEIYE
jgi:hypothetical protein